MTVAEYNSVVDQCADNLYRFLYKSVQDTDIAKDLVQDSFLKLWVNVRKLELNGARKYLFTIGYHCMIDYFRKSQKVHFNSEELQNLSIEPETNDLQELLQLALNQLPQVQKNLIMLRDYEGYNYQEISEITGLSESQVKVYLFRARTALKNMLIKYNKINPSV